MQKEIAVIMIIVILGWMVIGSIVNRKRMKRMEVNLTVGAGIAASTLIAIANLL